MNVNPIHYDGSIPVEMYNRDQTNTAAREPIQVTDEMRQNIGGNPYVFDIT